MSKLPRVNEFVLDDIHPLIQSFLERTTAEEWESFILGRPDDATTILVAELILEIIATLTNSFLTTLKSRTPKSKERFLSKLVHTLPQTLSDALGIQDEADKDGLKTLTDIIQEEVRENLKSSRSGGETSPTTQRITPTSRINAMIVQFVQVFKKSEDKIRKFIGPRPHRVHVERTPSSGEGLLLRNINSPIAEGIKNEINFEFKDIFSPLMTDIPKTECEELRHEISEDIEIVAVEISALSKTSTETLAVKPVGKKIKSFFTKCFAKVCLMRIFAQLKKKHPEHAEASSESVEMILEELSTQFVDHEDHKSKSGDALVQVFTDLCGNKLEDFNQELSDLIYRHTLAEPTPPSVEREIPSEVHADIRNKSWVFMALMNWYLNTQVKWVIDRVTVPYVDKSGVNLLPEPVKSDEDIARQEAQRVKNRSYVKFVIEKVVYTVCSDAKMLPATIYDVINNLRTKVWGRVKDRQFHTDSEVFNNLEEKIKKLLYKELGSPEKVMFLIMCEDPAVVDQTLLIVKEQLLTPRKRKSVIGGFFSSLGSAIAKGSKPSKDTFVLYAKYY